MKYRLLWLILLAATASAAVASNLVILHTNDTHSQVEPDDKDGLGGVARRKVVIDSVRGVEDNVLLVDAGDVVQGTLYFNLYKGEVENRLMDLLGYDIRILGNHEFDNGVESLASTLKGRKSEFLATNYDLSKSAIADIFKKYSIREVDGRKIGFIAVNLAPQGMISEGNYDGVEYLDAIESANAAAWWLRHIEGCDMVVAVTHIGYDPAMPPGDVALAKSSSDIDIIIGGHTHDLITPEAGKYNSLVANREGKDVLVTQVGKSGKNIGKITVDLDDIKATYEIIPINSRLDGRTDGSVEALVMPYRAGIDSLMAAPVGRTAKEMPHGSAEILNFATDLVWERGKEIAENVDFALLNKGGIRRGLPKGTITEGEIITMLPFNNRVQVIDIAGKDILPALEQMARVGGNGVSGNMEVSFSYDKSDKEAEIESVTIDGKPLDANRIYRVATIDYMANGGDYMPTLANHELVAESPSVLHNDILEHLRRLKNKKITPSAKVRFKQVDD